MGLFLNKKRDSDGSFAGDKMLVVVAVMLMMVVVAILNLVMER